MPLRAANLFEPCPFCGRAVFCPKAGIRRHAARRTAGGLPLWRKDFRFSLDFSFLKCYSTFQLLYTFEH